MTVAMVSPFFILKFPFLSWAFTVSFGNFFPALQKFFGTRIFCRGITRIAGDHVWPQNNDAAPPRRLPGDGARAARGCVSKIHLIQIRADFGWPSAYPKPGSRVTTTLYA